jgi:hypothetical protein
MNLYQKMNEARLLISNSEIKKSGYNKHLNFKYSELDDFMNHIIAFNKQLGLFSQFSLVDDRAVLSITDCDKPDDKVFFESPTAQAKLQGQAAPIQEIGSLMTYMRRYMYQIAYEITEGESLDGNIGQPQQSPPKTQSKQTPKQSPKPEPPQVITPNQAADLVSLCSQKGYALDKIMKVCKVTELADITTDLFTKAIEYLASLADVKQ